MYMSNRNTNQFSLLHNPIALICGCFCIVPGMLIGQIAGLMISLAYAPFISILGGGISGILGYWLNTDTKITPRNFYKCVALAMATVIGALWGGMILSPVLFFNAAFLSTKIALMLAITFGITLVAGSTYLIMLFIRDQSSLSINIFATMLIGMTLFGCVGLIFGPHIWAILLNVGLIAGLIASVVQNLFNNNTEASKILASLFSMSGVLIGVMLGVLVSSYIPFVSSAVVSLFFGLSLMLGGILLGHTIGSDYHEFNLNDATLRHKLYQATLLLPVIFLGYLSGGIIGFLYLPLSETLLSQAVGMIMSSGVYGFVLSTYYIVKNFIYGSTVVNVQQIDNNTDFNQGDTDDSLNLQQAGVRSLCTTVFQHDSSVNDTSSIEPVQAAFISTKPA
jgi:hypothetical protein